MDLSPLVTAVLRRRRDVPAHHSLLVGLSGMFRDLVLPLCRQRTHRLVASLAEETAVTFHDIDVVLLEGIFIYKRAYRAQFDLAVWIDCTFDTALERAWQRAQRACRPRRRSPPTRRSFSRLSACTSSGTTRARPPTSPYPTTRDSLLRQAYGRPCLWCRADQMRATR
jgi:hypothetical protein